MTPEIADGLRWLECKIAFLSAACMALSELPEGDRVVDGKTWTGLYLRTLEIENHTRELNELARQKQFFLRISRALSGHGLRFFAIMAGKRRLFCAQPLTAQRAYGCFKRCDAGNYA